MAAVAQDPGVAVEVGHARAARRGVHEGRVVRHQAEVGVVDLDLAQVVGADRAVDDRELVAPPRARIGDAEAVGHGARLGGRILLDVRVGHRCGPADSGGEKGVATIPAPTVLILPQ
jgi:hypothetical protein